LNGWVRGRGMTLGRRQGRQRELWIHADQLAAPPAEPFYRRLNEMLAEAGFDRFVETLCSPYYHAARGRRSMPPGVYFRLLMLAYFEAIDSERGLEWRAADSLSARGFLGLPLDKKAPDQTTISRTRRRLPEAVHLRVLRFVAAMLRGEKLLDGDGLAIDASTIEANASLRSLRRKDTGESYADWLRRLASAAGMQRATDDDLKRLDRARKGKRTSNKEWHNPHDPDARVGRTARGQTRMLYKAEHAVDTSSGAIVAARVCSVAGDTTTGPQTLERANTTIAQLHEDDPTGGPLPGPAVVMDKGYHSAKTLADHEECGFVPYTKERARRKAKARAKTQRKARKQSRQRKRKSKSGSPREHDALRRNRRRLRTQRGKRLMKRRAEYVERSFAHTLDRGRLRRTTLRGTSNLDKRHQGICAAFNLSLLMRHRHGAGTPKMLAIRLGLFGLLACLLTMTALLVAAPSSPASRSSTLRPRPA